METPRAAVGSGPSRRSLTQVQSLPRALPRPLRGRGHSRACRRAHGLGAAPSAAEAAGWVATQSQGGA